MVSSKVLQFEISKISDETRRGELFVMESLAVDVVKVDSQLAMRAKAFEAFGVQVFDALHLACAESCAEVLLTVDDKFIRKAQLVDDLNIRVVNPLVWLNEVL